MSVEELIAQLGLPDYIEVRSANGESRHVAILDATWEDIASQQAIYQQAAAEARAEVVQLRESMARVRPYMEHADRTLGEAEAMIESGEAPA